MAERLLQTLLVNSVVFAALFALVALVRWRLGRRLPAGLALALWAVLAVKLVLPFGIPSALSPLAWLHPAAPVMQPAAPAASLAPPSGAVASTGTQTIVSQSSDSLPVQPIGAMLADDTPQWEGQMDQDSPSQQDITVSGQGGAVAPATTGGPVAGNPAGWAQWLLLLWLSGAVGVGLWLALGHWALRRHLRRALPPTAAAQQALLACCRELGIHRPVVLKLLRGGGSPAIAGLLRPVVLVDAALGQDIAALRAVLLHELNHCRSGDLWAIFGLNLLTVVYWFHPLVWALVALARRDMETRCDQRVLARLRREDQQDYVNTLLHFAGYGRRLRSQAALGMSVSRKAMERRIRDMFRSRRPDGFTRGVTVGCAALMLCVGILTACTAPTGQPVAIVTVNPTAVVQDAATVLPIIPDASATPALTTATVAPEIPTATPAPTATPTPHRTQSYPGAEDGVTITVDADILQPDGPMPIVRLAPQEISMDQVRKMAQVLFDGQQAYEPQAGFTKAEVQDKINDLQKLIDSRDKVVAENGGGKDGEAAADSLIKDYTKSLKAYQKRLATAPQSILRKPTDWAFHVGNYYKGFEWYGSAADSRKTQRILLEADLDGGYLGYLKATNYASDTGVRHDVSFDLGGTRDWDGSPQWDSADTQPMTLSADQAVTMAQAKLEAMGIQGYALSSVSPMDIKCTIRWQNDSEIKKGVYGYSINFMPAYGGIPQAQCLTYGMYSDKAAIGPSYSYDRLTVRVVNDRIAGVYWNSPVQVVQTEVAAATLLPLDDILAAFQAYMHKTITRAWLTHEAPENPGYKERLAALTGGEVKITRIQLTLYRMRDKDHALTFRTMPVWRFYGKQNTRHADGATSGEGPASSVFITDPDGSWSSLVATFNAVDGSLFDEYKGY